MLCAVDFPNANEFDTAWMTLVTTGGSGTNTSKALTKDESSVKTQLQDESIQSRLKPIQEDALALLSQIDGLDFGRELSPCKVIEETRKVLLGFRPTQLVICKTVGQYITMTEVDEHGDKHLHTPRRKRQKPWTFERDDL